MKRRIKRIISIVLTFALVAGVSPRISFLSENNTVYAATVSNPRVVNGTVEYDYVYFGNYPQTEVKNPSYEIANANYGYDNSAVVNGVRYRRIKRSDATYEVDSDSYYNWNVSGDSNGYHYFKYEPIKWRVLSTDGNSAFLLADKALDTQQYNKGYTVVTWETCTLRNFLNNEFKNRAFNNLQEQNAIVNTYVINDNNPEYDTTGGNDTNDKIFLLSLNEIKESAYGFDTDWDICDKARCSTVSDYGRAMGAYTSTAGNCYWWLRSPGNDTSGATDVSDDGCVFGGGDYVGTYNLAVRPALHLNLKSSDVYTVVDSKDVGNSQNQQSGNRKQTISAKSKKVVYGNKTVRLNAKTSGDGKLTYSSSNKKIVTVNKKGKITAKGYGKATITIKASATTTFSAASKKITITVVPKKMQITSAASHTTKKMDITWKKDKTVSGYQMYFSLKKKFNMDTYQRILSTSEGKLRVFGLQSKKSYYIKIRAYKKVGKKKYYGAWSKVKKVTIK